MRTRSEGSHSGSTAGGLPHQRLREGARAAGVEVHAKEQGVFEHGAVVRQAHAPAPHHHAARAARLAAAGDAVGIGGEKGAEEGGVAIAPARTLTPRPPLPSPAPLPHRERGRQLPSREVEELVPRFEDEAGGACVQILGEGGSAVEGFQGVQAVEGFQGVQAVEEVGARGSAGAGSARCAGKGVALGEEGGEQGGLAGVAAAVPFDEEAGEAGVDGQARHRPAQGGHAVIVEGAELARARG